ncbi:MAG: hypothetical protein PHV16_00030 [Candidatus Nanoarchaeia archaeon]|nr:hypothetical protein [Candidatus Nanoarchaeia archaeon]
MNEEYKQIIKEAELNFIDTNRIIDERISNEQETVKGFKHRVLKSATALIIASLIGFSSYSYNHLKKIQDINFQKSMYYQSTENEKLEEVADKVCIDNYDLEKIINLNLKFDDYFDLNIEKNEIVHFPLKFVRNKELLKEFENEKKIILSKIYDRKNAVDTLTFENFKEKIGIIHQTLDNIDDEIKMFSGLVYNKNFKQGSSLIIAELHSLRDYINRKLNVKEAEIDKNLEKLVDIIKSNSFSKIASSEKLEKFILKSDEIENCYLSLGVYDKAKNTEKIKENISGIKSKYMDTIDNTRKTIEGKIKDIEKLTGRAYSLFQNGIKNEELNYLNLISIDSQCFDNYDKFMDEILLKTEVNAYKTEVSKLNNILNENFLFAFKNIDTKLKEIEEFSYEYDAIFENITKDKVDHINNYIYKLNDYTELYSIIKNNVFFDGNEQIEDKIKKLRYTLIDQTDEKKRKAESDFLKLKKTIYNNKWDNPGTDESLEQINLKLSDLENFYFSFSDDNMISEIKKASDYVKTCKKEYESLIKRVEQDIKNKTNIAEEIIENVNGLMKNEVYKNELGLIKKLKDKADSLQNYIFWSKEDSLKAFINQYKTKKENAVYIANKKFEYELGVLDSYFNNLYEEVSCIEGKWMNKNDYKRLEYIMENELVVLKNKYYILENNQGINKVQTLISSIDRLLMP